MIYHFKQLIAFIPAWLLYYAGDLTSKLMKETEKEWPFILYSKLMVWSIQIQDWAKLSKPWSTPKKNKKTKI